MNVRRWLQHLKNLRHRVRACYLNALFRAKLCRRRLTVPEAPSQNLTVAGTDLPLTDQGRSLRLICSDAVTLTPAYQDWIAPLMQLPANAAPAEVRSALESLLHDQSTDGVQRVYFSRQDYMRSLPAALNQATEFVQFGFVTQQPAINLLNALLTQDVLQVAATAAPAVVLIHGQPLTNPK